MPLETGTYISDLNAANPASTDSGSQGDDHLRLIKNLIKNTFPNLNAAVTVTPTELNKLVGLTATAANINTISGLTATTVELNKLAGATVSTTEINRLAGVTSAIQTQIDAKVSTSAYTAADVLAKLITVDGVGSGLDADLLDGNSSTFYLDATNINAGTLADARLPADITHTRIPKATNAQALAGTDDTVFSTPLRVKEAVASLLVAGVGTDVYNMAGSRTVGTAYQNTTGKNIVVHVDASHTNGGVIMSEVSNDGVTYLSLLATLNGCTFIVGQNNYYRLRRVSGSGGSDTIYSWVEAR